MAYRQEDMQRYFDAVDAFEANKLYDVNESEAEAIAFLGAVRTLDMMRPLVAELGTSSPESIRFDPASLPRHLQTVQRWIKTFRRKRIGPYRAMELYQERTRNTRMNS